MDTFMDKLAQKLTAQEMIKANSAAETEELKQLRGQIKEYHDCLEQMQEINRELREVNDQMGRVVSEKITPEISRLVDSSVLRLESAQTDTTEIERLVQDSYTRIQEITNENSERLQRMADESLQQLQRVVTESLQQLRGVAGESQQRLQGVAGESLQQLQNVAGESLQQLQGVAGESLQQLQGVAGESQQKLQEFQQGGQDLEGIKQALNEMTENSNDYVHRECVKVYRNVQAVVVEEEGKQTEALNEKVKFLKGKIGVVTGVSVAALVFSIAGVVLQVLSALHIF